MKELKLKIEKEIREIEELTDFYLARHDEDPLNRRLEERLIELRYQKQAYLKVLEMIEGEE